MQLHQQRDEEQKEKELEKRERQAAQMEPSMRAVLDMHNKVNHVLFGHTQG